MCVFRDRTPTSQLRKRGTGQETVDISSSRALLGCLVEPTDKGFLRPIPIQIFGDLKI